MRIDYSDVVYEEWSKQNENKRNRMEIGDSELMMGFGYVNGVIVDRRGQINDL